MENKYWFLSFGGSLIILGIVIIIIPEPHIGWDFYNPIPNVDLTKVKWIVGPCFIIWGLLSFIIGLKSKRRIHYKCINCGKVFELKKDFDYSCSDCNNLLEELDGFFERHPEFKEK